MWTRNLTSASQGAAPPLRLSPSIMAQTALLVLRRIATAPAQGRPAGRSWGPQQNSNFPFISAASSAILKVLCSTVSSQAN